MAGDWIKMRSNLDTDPRIIELADDLKVHVLHMVGMLWRVWCWADSHSLDGNALRVTEVTLDRIADMDGFAIALRKVGWLEGRNGALTFPRFEQHNGQTAKKRAETQARVNKHRSRKASQASQNCNASVTPEALPEKRREEKNKTPKPPLNKMARDPPSPDLTVDQVFRDLAGRFAFACTKKDRYGRPFYPQEPRTLEGIAVQFQEAARLGVTVDDIAARIDDATRDHNEYVDAFLRGLKPRQRALSDEEIAHGTYGPSGFARNSRTCDDPDCDRQQCVAKRDYE
jgi:hypothetical protein